MYGLMIGYHADRGTLPRCVCVPAYKCTSIQDCSNKLKTSYNFQTEKIKRCVETESSMWFCKRETMMAMMMSKHTHII